MNSQFSQFYKKTYDERLALLKEAGWISNPASFSESGKLEASIADSLIENQIGQFTLPMGVGLNFIIDGTDYIVPMVTEEPSVIAACSHAAKLARIAGGFQTLNKRRRMLGQIIIQYCPDIYHSYQVVTAHLSELIEAGNHAHPSMKKRGGGLTDIIPRFVRNIDGEAEFLTLDCLFDTKDAMGANMMNSVLEALAPKVEELTNGEALLKILSNYPNDAVVEASCVIPFTALAKDEHIGKQIASRIESATHYAMLDPHRAATHNKGIMNGIEAVVLATGNDTRAMAAAAYTFASQTGQMQPLTTWKVKNDGLYGKIALPITVGTVGGAINVLPQAKEALHLLRNPSAEQLARIIASVGLAQNLAALKALVSEGIQRGHMSLHAKSLAIHAGAKEHEIQLVAEYLKAHPPMNAKKAEDFLRTLR